MRGERRLQNIFLFRWATLKEKVIEVDKDLTADVEVKDTGAERGCGVFATKMIPKHTYICEYRATIRTQAQYEKLKDEYETNEEGSYVLEGQVGSSWLIFDATRKLDQCGRYINHARHGVNVKPHPPLKVHRKYREHEQACCNSGQQSKCKSGGKFWYYRLVYRKQRL